MASILSSPVAVIQHTAIITPTPSPHQHHHHTNTNTTTHPSYDPEVMVRNVTKAASLREFMTNPQGLRYWTNTYAMHTTSPTTLHPRLYMLCSTLP